MEPKEIEIERLSAATILTSFTGRLSRKTYFKYLVIVTVPFLLAAWTLPGYGRERLGTLVLDGLYLLCCLALGIKRLHDQDLSGWYAVPLNFGPKILGFVLPLFLGGVGVALAVAAALGTIYVYFFRPGSAGPNGYGSVERNEAYHHVPDQDSVDFYASL